MTSASDGLVQWSESYDREGKDVFALQDDVTRSIVSALQIRLAANARPLKSGTGTANAEAYDIYLRGLYLFRRRGAGLLRAAEFFEQAIAKDTMFARAHAALATVLLTEPYYSMIRVADVLPRARAAAERAVAIDPDLADGYQALALAHFHAFEFDASEKAIRHAVGLDPNSAEALYRLGFILLSVGRVKESIPALERAKVIDPLYSLVAGYLGYGLALDGQNDAATAEGRRAVELDSTLIANQTLLTFILRAAGRPGDALAVARRVLTQTNDTRRLGMAAYSIGRLGGEKETRAIIARLEPMPAETPGRNSGLTYAYLGVGDTASALSAMERAAAGDGDLLWVVAPSDPTWDAVRSSPRFAALLRRWNMDVARLTEPHGSRPK